MLWCISIMSIQSTTKYITDLSHIREFRACVSPWLLSKDFAQIKCEQRALTPAISLYLPMSKYITQTPTVSNQIAWSDWSVAWSPWSVKRICFLPGFLAQQRAQRFCFAFPSFRCESFQQKSIFPVQWMMWWHFCRHDIRNLCQCSSETALFCVPCLWGIIISL